MNNNGFKVLYRAKSGDRPYSSCYWADNYYEANQYAEMVGNMFPELEVVTKAVDDE